MSAYVSTQWLEEHLHDDTVVVIESSVERASYDAAHVPGARWADFHADLLRNGDDTSGLIPTPEQFAALMSRYGVEPECTVVWYGDRHSSYGIRGFWMMDYYQHPGAFHVLEGGRERWLTEKRPVATGAPTVVAGIYPVPASRDASSLATLQQVRNAIGMGGAVVLDVRAAGEYDGTTVRAKRSGHIPGAVNIEWTEAAAGDNVLKTEQELRAMYESAGVTPDKAVIAHCQLGIRAAHTWFVLKHVLGYPDVRNYDGSWAEWGNRDDTPIER